MTFAAVVLGAALNPGGFIAWIVVGLIAGFVAGKIMSGSGYGLLGDLIMGLIGAIVGGLVANLLIPDANFGLIGSIIVSIIGACLLIWLVRAFTGGRRRAKR